MKILKIFLGPSKFIETIEPAKPKVSALRTPAGHFYSPRPSSAGDSISLMKFSKPSLGVEEQIALLERRGMAVPDSEQAAHHLRHISYYRLRAYWLDFETEAKVDGDHAFAPGTDFWGYAGALCLRPAFATFGDGRHRAH